MPSVTIVTNQNSFIMNEEKMSGVGPSSIEMAFQRLGDPSAPPVLLIMGAGAQMIAWPDGFCETLTKRRLHVIRFDNRDTGLSTHFTNAPTPDFSAALSGDFSSVSYSLSDMAADTIGLMDALEFDQVHIVGASMGGMIAQTMAIEYPGRIKSLTSIMSTTGDPVVGQPDYHALSELGEPPYSDRPGYINWKIRSLKIIGSPGYPFDEAAAAITAGLSWDRDHDPASLLRQFVAVMKSGDRTSKLRHLQVPALVIHGAADKMVNVSGGKATAAAIPGAHLHIFEGMGHGLPELLWPEISSLIAEHIQRAEQVNC